MTKGGFDWALFVKEMAASADYSNLSALWQAA